MSPAALQRRYRGQMRGDGGRGTGLHTSLQPGHIAFTILVSGEINATTSEQFRAATDRAWSCDSARALLVDLRGVSSFSPLSVADLLAVTDRAHQLGRRIGFVIGANRAVVRPLSFVALTDRIPLFYDRFDALRFVVARDGGSNAPS